MASRVAVTTISQTQKVVLSMMLFAAAYGMASLAIDNGSILLYIITIATVYLAFKLIIEVVIQRIKKDDGRGKAKKAR